MQTSSRYLTLGGSRRAYYDTVRRQVMSRREYLKRQGVFPQTTGVARGSRSDKGCTHRPLHPVTQPFLPFVKQVKLPHGNVAEIHPVSAFVYEVYIRQIWVASLQLEQRGKRRRWHCGSEGCPIQADNQTVMARHCYEAHYLDACQLAGVGPRPILPVHEIHARERRARMPWRYEAPEVG